MKRFIALIVLTLFVLTLATPALAKKKPARATGEKHYVLVVIDPDGAFYLAHRVGKGEKEEFFPEEGEGVGQFFVRVLQKLDLLE